MTSLEQLRRNVRDYIRKAYLAKVINGMVTTALLATAGWLLVALLEYFGHFNILVRGVLFFGYLWLFLTLLTLKVIVPFARMRGWMRHKSDQDAALEIGRALSEVDDKLVNALYLERQASTADSPLLQASLLQKATGLNRYQFASLVNLRDSVRWAPYLLLPFGISLLLLWWNPALLRDSSVRVFRFDQSFIPPAPFRFELENSSLTVPEGASFTLSIRTVGDRLPDQVFLSSDGREVRMKKVDDQRFSYTFEHVLSSVEWQLNAAGVESETMMLRVIPVPKLLRNAVLIDYPDYTGLRDEQVTNRVQYRVPEGATLRWTFDFKNTLGVRVSQKSAPERFTDLKQGSGSGFSYAQFVDGDDQLLLLMSNDEALTDSALLTWQSIPDQLPAISAEEMFDTNSVNVRYFNGEVSDDYGFSRLLFHCTIRRHKGGLEERSTRIPLPSGTVEQRFHYLINLDTMNLQPEDEVSYYFEVWDNDGVNGAKSSRTVVWKYQSPSLEALRAQNEQVAAKSKESLESVMKELQKLEREMDELKKDILQKKNPDWQDKERMKEMLEKQKEMMDKLMQRAMEQQKQQRKNNQLQQYSEELMDKQEKIQEMFESLFDEEFREKYEEYQKLLEQMNKEQMLEQVDQMKLDNEQLEKEMDRTLELFKQLEFEQKLEESIQQIESLREKQDALNEETERKEKSSEDLAREQDELTKEMEQVSQELDKLQELNEALMEPKDMPETKSEQQNAQESMQQSSEQLKQNNKKKSSESQKSAAESLEKMSDKLKSFQEQEQEEQQMEDLNAMRQILENLVDLSLAQESVMEQLKGVQMKDPRYVALAKDQMKVIEDTKVVEDSLLALSKRVVEISKFINDEITEVKYRMSEGLDQLTHQQPGREREYREKASANQQYAMTSLNNLANMFDEMIRQSQDQMNSKMNGTGQCNKPGSGKGSKPSAAEMRKMQENLNKQLEQLKQQMEKGQNPNGKSPGNSSGGGMSKELARMAAEQAAIREQLRQMSESLEPSDEGGKPGSQLKELERLMEQTEEDILFQNISQETILRQEQILTKLLESEKAERERELEEKRESKEPDQLFEIPADVWEKYLQERQNELELYRTLPANLKPYYRKQVNRYFSEFGD